MREGIDLVFRWQSLKVFHAEELQHMLWSDIEWDMQGLVKIVLPGPSWPDGREQVTWLRELLISMSKHERRAFVRFVTASVCKPTPGNPIIIQPQVETASSSSSSSSVVKGVGEADKKLPTCRTCVNSLYLPNYSNAEVLQERLRVAIWEEHIAFD
jgi:E3 ubiquitin-protein ligase TRIP12